MSDTVVALVLGSALWFIGGAAFIASLVSGATLFAPFSAVLILLGMAYCVVAAVKAAAGRRPRDTDPLA